MRGAGRLWGDQPFLMAALVSPAQVQSSGKSDGKGEGGHSLHLAFDTITG